MQVKGFIIEDDQGRELVLVRELLSEPLGKAFLLRGWQRRRLVPINYTKLEYEEVMEEVLLTLSHLCMNQSRYPKQGIMTRYPEQERVRHR